MPGNRKPGAYKWFEIQDSVDYFELFAQPKIIYQEIQFHPAYAVDSSGYFLNNKGFLIPSDDRWLAGVLNSPLMWWFNWRYLVHLKDEALSPAGEKMVSLPIATPSPKQKETVGKMVGDIAALTKTNHEAVAGAVDLLQTQFHIEQVGNRLGDFPSLDEKGFIAEVVKRRGPKNPLTSALLKALRALFQTEAPPVQERRVEIRRLEEVIAREVNSAYGLTKADEKLLWETAPPRMPFVPTGD